MTDQHPKDGTLNTSIDQDLVGLAERAGNPGGVEIEGGTFMPLNLIAGGYVYVRQGQQQITLDHDQALLLADVLVATLRARAAITEQQSKTGVSL